jgi:hypothetical protein
MMANLNLSESKRTIALKFRQNAKNKKAAKKPITLLTLLPKTL